MITAEKLAHVIQLEKRGIYALIWDEKVELVRALAVFLAALTAIRKIRTILLSSKEAERELREIFEAQPKQLMSSHSTEPEMIAGRDELLLLFLQQAASKTIGPILNGWRNALADSPGSLLVIRSADLTDFQRAAPDLFSYVGPKCVDSSTLLSLWSKETARKMQTRLPDDILEILEQLPGEIPSVTELEEWQSEHQPLDNGEKQSGES